MEVSTSFLCQGMYGNLDAFLADDDGINNSWCQVGFPNVPVPGPVPSCHVPIDRRKDRESSALTVKSGRTCSLLDDEDVELERQHYRILSSHQVPVQVLTQGVESPASVLTTRNTLTANPRNRSDSQNSHTSSWHTGNAASASSSKGGSRLSAHGPLSRVPSTQSRTPSLASDVVLGEGIMEELQDHLPFCKRGESFWLQYSLVRDGASLEILLDKVRDSESTILAVETVEGEVFGAFCTCPWKPSHDYFGSGQSFLWRLDDDDKVQVFKFAFLNHNIQLCHLDRLVVGGGGDTTQAPPSLAEIESSSTSSFSSSNPTSCDTYVEWGFGLWLEQDLLRGSSSPCLTFQSPALSKIHADGTCFEIRNLEVWALTPCISVEQALATQRQRRLISGALIPRALSLMAGHAVPSLFGLSKK